MLDPYFFHPIRARLNETSIYRREYIANKIRIHEEEDNSELLSILDEMYSEYFGDCNDLQ